LRTVYDYRLSFFLSVSSSAAVPELWTLDAIAHHKKHNPNPNTKNMPPIGPLLSGLFFLVYVVCVIAVIIYVLRLLGRFVNAHERIASALEIVARKLRDDGKP
jgi:hypothetical protein